MRVDPERQRVIRSAPACPIRKSSAACRSAQLRLLAPLRSASHRVHRSRAALSADAPPTRSFAAPRNPAPGTRAARASRTLRVRRPRHTCHAVACRRSARDPRRKQVARSRAFTPTHDDTCSHSWIAHWALPLAGGIGHHTARGASAGRLHAGSPTTHHRVAAPRPPLTSGHQCVHIGAPGSAGHATLQPQRAHVRIPANHPAFHACAAAGAIGRAASPALEVLPSAACLIR